MSRVRSYPLVTMTSRTTGRFVEDLVQGDLQPSTFLVVCSTRSQFLEQIAWHVLSSKESVTGDIHLQQGEPGPSSDAGDGELDRVSLKKRESQLLEPTLRFLAMGLQTNVIFCTNIPSFRAYVSTLAPRINRSQTPHPRIIFMDMLAMHHGTSEFTVQGLSRSFAMLAAVNHQTDSRIDIIECNDIRDRTDPQRGPRLWQTEVPLLSGSVRIGEAGQGWASRTTNIKSFAGRWFRFDIQ